jgi:hypothetical protein
MLREQLRKEEDANAAAQEELDRLEIQKAQSKKRMSIAAIDIHSNPDDEGVPAVDQSLAEEEKKVDEHSRLQPEHDFRAPSGTGRSAKSNENLNSPDKGPADSKVTKEEPVTESQPQAKSEETVKEVPIV